MSRAVTVARPGQSRAKVAWSVLAWLVALVFFFPVLWMMLEALKTESQAASIPPTIAFIPTLAQFQEVLSRDFPPFFINSAIATIGSTLLVLLLGLPAAYARETSSSSSSRRASYPSRPRWSRSTCWREISSCWTTSSP